MESFVELIEDWLGRGWATLAAIVALLIPVGLLCLVASGVTHAGIFEYLG